MSQLWTTINGNGPNHLNAMATHNSDAICEHGNIALANCAANHKPNRVLAGQVQCNAMPPLRGDNQLPFKPFKRPPHVLQAGAVKAVLNPLKANIHKPVYCFTACNALIALCQVGSTVHVAIVDYHQWQ